jgi:L-fucose isomerase-like protein
MGTSTGFRARIGVVPTYRTSYRDWCREIHGRCRKALAAIDGVEVVEIPSAGPGATREGAVQSLDEAKAAAASLRARGVDGIVILPLDFGDERSPAEVAADLRVPVLLFATKEPPRQKGGRQSDSYCGTLTISSALHRRGVPFRFGGVVFPEEPAFADEVATFARAAAAASGFRGARIGVAGHRPASFESVMCDEAALLRKFGQIAVPCDLGDLSEAAKALSADDPRLAPLVAEIKGTGCRVPPDARIDMMARVQLAFEDFARAQGLAAIGGRCWPTLTRLAGFVPCAVYGRLTARGLPVSCEADVLGAGSMLLSYRSVLGRDVPHFIDWTINHPTAPNRLLAWHCGNAPACLAGDPSTIRLNDYGTYEFQLRPGPVTFCRVMQYGDDWKMLIASGRAVTEPSAEGGTWSWIEVADHERHYRTLIEEGFIHHASMMHGDQAAILKEACVFLGLRPVVVA